jgi:hypothetical protein
MDNRFIFGSSVSIWDTGNNERVRIGIGTCKDTSIIPIYRPCGMETT